MQVRDIMTTSVITVPPTMPVGELAALLREHDLRGVPVLDEAGELVGMVTEVELVARHARPHLPAYIQFMEYRVYIEGTDRFDDEMERILGTTVADVMAEEVQTISPDAGVQDLATLMVEHHVNPVPVVEDGRLVGIVSYWDLLSVLELPGQTEPEPLAGDEL
ncbi:MAG TPA: CBS domain-containing protein [Ardenticatenaceae bacterium]|nr:CBS domain-containing protein [Ardenticatenaceae bacterium]